jgi:WhiB family redox-sensing transcriptional regulator
MAALASDVTSFDDEVSDVGHLLDLLSRRPAWMEAAACRDHPETNWFPQSDEDCRPAISICQDCPVLVPCREWALAQPASLHGIWGGLTARRRRTIRAARRRARAGATT